MPNTRQNDLRRHWGLDPEVVFLNHGSFGACPRPVLETQQRWRDRMERQPVQFFARDIESLIDDARDRLAAFLGAEQRDVAFVPNATAGVNAVLRSLDLEPGDEVVTTNHEYNACRAALQHVCEQSGAAMVVAEIPFPIDGPDTVVDRILAAVTDRTRLVLVDHVTSPTGLVLPIGRIVSELSKRGIDTLVDGAHGPGMLPLNLGELGAAYYTGNCHKWMCAPKGAAFLHVRRDRQEGLHPVSISHGWDVPRDDRPRLHLEFDWVGTVDPTAWLSVPAAIEFMESVIEGGWPAVMQRNRETALKARAMACDILGIALPAPEGMVGSLASVPLPDGTHEATGSALYVDPLQEVWLERFGVEVPIIPWPRAPKRLLRISAQVYNGWSDYERLAEAIRSL